MPRDPEHRQWQTWGSTQSPETAGSPYSHRPQRRLSRKTKAVAGLGAGIVALGVIGSLGDSSKGDDADPAAAPVAAESSTPAPTRTADKPTPAATHRSKVTPKPSWAPVPSDDWAGTDYQTATSIDVLENDDVAAAHHDADGPAPDAVLKSVAQPRNGTTTIKDGRVRYTPDHGFSGADTFTYRVKVDGRTASGTVHVSVHAKPTPTPTATPTPKAPPKRTPTPTPAAPTHSSDSADAPQAGINPGGFCGNTGAIGTYKGKIYTCAGGHWRK
ncbi:Ig-like domain-containing protein [Streptomyces sp. NBC_00483]|uniref:Ig-like domain-containing protein n=1 Tax=Streptomyces sp. NBC_00483 TaxID=2975756 RepID=UPI002E1813C9